MHTLPSRKSIAFFRFAALFLITASISATVTCCHLFHCVMVDDAGMRIPLLISASSSAFFGIAYWLSSRRTLCPLCRANALTAARHSKNHKVRKLLGSHRLRVAFSVIFRSAFRCPYCGETSALKCRR